MISPEASIHAAQIILPAVLALVVGFIAGRFASRTAVADAELLDFIEQSGQSLQCIPGEYGDDTQWAVTNGNKVVGLPSLDMREAIRSAAGAEVSNGQEN